MTTAGIRAAGRPGGLCDLRWLALGAGMALVAFLSLVPLGYLLWQSVHTPATAQAAGVLTLENHREALGASGTGRLLGNSLVFADGTALLAFVIGTVLAWMNERTNTPFKTLFYALSVVPLIVPGVLFTIAWILLASPKIGLVNLALQALTGSSHVFVDVYSMGGMIWVDGLHYSPVAFLIMSAAFRSMDPSLEESALMSGATAWQVAWRVSLRLSWPAAVATLLILFIRAIESFEVPALIGLPVGLQVYTSAIYQAIHQYPSRIGLASAYATVLLVVATIGIYLQSLVTRHSRRYVTVTGKGFRPRVLDLGPWRYLTAAVFILYAALIVLLPFLVLLWSSFQSFYAVPSIQALQNMTLDPYRAVLGHHNFWPAVLNSVALALGTATLVMLLTSVICWTVVRTRWPGRWLLDQLASLPIVLPGLVVGLAYMVFFLNVDVGIYGTVWILLLAYATRFMPYGMRYNTTALLQVHQELEDSAQMSGASWGATFGRIVLPLLEPGLLAGWIFVLIVSMRELSSSILLYSPGSEVLAIVVWELWEAGQLVELSALGVMFMVALLFLVMTAQWLGGKYGVKQL